MIDLCEPIINGVAQQPQVVIRYKKNGNIVTRQQAFNELLMTEAITHAYQKGVFTPAATRRLIDALKSESYV
ncbi:hypothetical protein ABES21_21340 [Peribacillus frigoritolerans]|uniref:hypothetical protein n=1 Tax=Peribacillus frigoritolerans TaxID=450367 RepID=UPI003D275CCF